MLPPVLTIAELNRLARQTLESRFPLMWVAGEISNFKCYPLGHCYFTLKDAEAQVRAVMFRSRVQSLSFAPRDGQQVEAQALVTLYEPRGDFQLQIESLRCAGLGRLYEAFLRLKDQLAAEGLLLEARKRPLPRLPSRIGIITSPQTAALRDVLAALRRRAPHLSAILYPAPVQGEGAAQQLASAIALANRRAEVDVLLLVRGGGSLEDLWAFNEEILARAIAASALPVIAGVGHESDVTIADLVADWRAATPTAAAEIATAGWLDVRRRLIGLADALRAALRYRLRTAMQRLDGLAVRLRHPASRLREDRRRLQMLALRLANAGERRLARHHLACRWVASRLQRVKPDLAVRRQRLSASEQRLRHAAERLLAVRQASLAELAAKLAALSPRATLERGFSIVRDADGRIVRDATGLQLGAPLRLCFAAGEARARVEEVMAYGVAEKE